MVRTVYIQRKVLELYQQMSTITYPIQPLSIIPHLTQHCRALTYQDMAIVNQCSIQDVAVMCKSNSGATHYDTEHDRYLILYNNAMNQGRVRWTISHEIGHICIGHLEIIEEAEIAYSEWQEPYNQFESEADYFVWNLIAPLPIMREMGIRTAYQVQTVYGLSAQAAALHYDRYLKWCRSHIKTAWENNMLREFRCKFQK